MDVAMCSVIASGLASEILNFIVSYNIACKYSIHFLTRTTEGVDCLLPPNFNLLAFITWLIGKFHLAGHQEDCVKRYSFNYTPGVGRMSGELVETIWACFNWLKYQTQQMAEGSWRDMLSDVMNFWNWEKTITLC
jgi:Kyakuja-Dileera-Zisupton transposase